MEDEKHKGLTFFAPCCLFSFLVLFFSSLCLPDLVALAGGGGDHAGVAELGIGRPEGGANRGRNACPIFRLTTAGFKYG